MVDTYNQPLVEKKGDLQCKYVADPRLHVQQSMLLFIHLGFCNLHITGNYVDTLHFLYFGKVF